MVTHASSHSPGPQILHSVITCPKCGHQREEMMPTDACLFFYDCTACGARLKPKTGEKRHSFSSWARTLDWVVQNIFGMVPLLDGNTEAQDRIQSPHMTFLRKLVIEIERKGKLHVPFSASSILELCEEASIDVPGIKYGRSYDEKYERGVVGKVMAHFFKTGESYAMEGYRVDREEEEVTTTTGNREMKKFYTVSRATPVSD